MTVRWTNSALGDLVRLYAFLESVNPAAASKVVQLLVQAPESLVDNPRIGERLVQFGPREVRRIFAGPYEIRYEISTDALYILKIWHSREDR